LKQKAACHSETSQGNGNVDVSGNRRSPTANGLDHTRGSHETQRSRVIRFGNKGGWAGTKPAAQYNAHDNPMFPQPCAPAKRVVEAMNFTEDAEETLNDIRRLLLSPSERLVEARLEELLDILAELDEAVDARLQQLERKFDRQCEKLKIDIVELLEDQSEKFNRLNEQINNQDSELSRIRDELDRATRSRIEPLHEKVEALLSTENGKAGDSASHTPHRQDSDEPRGVKVFGRCEGPEEADDEPDDKLQHALKRLDKLMEATGRRLSI
jgi:hypothetical protein